MNLRDGYDFRGVSVSPLQERGLKTTIAPFLRLPYVKNHTLRARDLRKTMTPMEKKIWFELLQPLQKQLNIRIHRQRPIIRFIVDFYIPSHKLAIEIDGETHYTKEGIEYDNARTQILNSIGVKILRFTNTDVINTFEWVCTVIQDKLLKIF